MGGRGKKTRWCRGRGAEGSSSGFPIYEPTSPGRQKSPTPRRLGAQSHAGAGAMDSTALPAQLGDAETQSVPRTA